MALGLQIVAARNMDERYMKLSTGLNAFAATNKLIKELM